jgi:3-hydroxyisobutyrate dehydrogenase-like beta-hydroxyacid dehydrogenase
MRVAFLGLGKMGSVIARHLLKAGHEVNVWNRTPAATESLAKEGARVATSPAGAVAEAEVAFTMVMDDAALEAILFTGGAIQALPPDSIHVSLSTISVKLSERITEAHNAARQYFIAAPVFGRPNIAEERRLWIAVAGEPAAFARVRPLLETFSRGITVVSETPSGAHALKLGGNFLITAMIASLSESFVYADALGLDTKIFLETVNSALFQSPFYLSYGKVMLDPPEQPGSTIALGEKDMRLFREAAASAHARTPLADTFEANLKTAIEAGMKDQDWAAGYYRLMQSMTRNEQ